MKCDFLFFLDLLWQPLSLQPADKDVSFIRDLVSLDDRAPVITFPITCLVICSVFAVKSGKDCTKRGSSQTYVYVCIVALLDNFRPIPINHCHMNLYNFSFPKSLGGSNL